MRKRLSLTVLAALCLLMPAKALGDAPLPSLHISFDSSADSGVTISDALLGGVYQPAQAPEYRGGVVGEAMMFDGYSTSMTLSTFSLQGGDLSVCVWVAPRAFPARGDGEKAIVAQYRALRFSRSGFYLGVGAFGQIVYRLALEETNGRVMMYGGAAREEAGAVLAAGAWSHLALVYDQAAAEARVYLNGKKVAAQTFPAGCRFVPGQEVLLRIGDDETADKVHDLYSLGAFSGLMDELYIYDCALDDDQIVAMAAVPPQHAADTTYNRQRVAKDRYRPSYHTQCGQMWMNEAIAPFFHNGQYHLFYQTNLSGPYYRQASWGHMVSEDLIHWADLPPALMAQSGEIDPDACFSGSAAFGVDGTPVLFYTGVRLGGTILNRITSASPVDDQLVVWEKSQKVLIEQPDDCSPTDFRDPFIFEEGDWSYMLVASSTKGSVGETGDGDPLVVIYRAPRGQYEAWRRLGTLLTGNSSRWPESGSCWECPVFLKLSNDDGTISKYFLAVSVTGSNISVYYWLGSFLPSTGAFVPDHVRPTRLDNGMINLVGASTGFVDPKTGAALISSTINDGRTARERFDSGWSGFNTLWRALSLNDDGTLHIAPMEGYALLHTKTAQEMEHKTLREINAALQVLDGSAHICIGFSAGDDVGLLIGYPDGQRIRLSYDAAQGLLTMDTSRACPPENSMAGISQAALASNGEGRIILEIYIDHCVVEVYANERVCMTGILLTEADGLALQLLGNGETVVDQMAVWWMP